MYRIRKKAATISVTTLFHSGTGSETWTRKMLPSADFEDGLKVYNNNMLCKHVGQSPALRPLSLNQPSRNIPKLEHLHGVGPQLHIALLYSVTRNGLRIEISTKRRIIV